MGEALLQYSTAAFWYPAKVNLQNIQLSAFIAQPKERPKRNMKSTSAGAAVYTPLFLNYIYDHLTHGLYCPYVWRCSSAKLRTFFSNHILHATASFSSSLSSPTQHSQRPTPRILDIGVGTGYSLEHAPIAEDTEVILADLNPACLEVAKSRVVKTHPGAVCEAVIADFLVPDQRGLLVELLGSSGIDAISMMLLLHCLPGPPARKAKALEGLRHLLRPDGVIFGAAILGRGVRHSLVGKFIMLWHNLLGVFGLWR
jgi:SAM-dependent methyltransferase